jgi:hypothetical protein
MTFVEIHQAALAAKPRLETQLEKMLPAPHHMLVPMALDSVFSVMGDIAVQLDKVAELESRIRDLQFRVSEIEKGRK